MKTGSTPNGFKRGEEKGTFYFYGKMGIVVLRSCWGLYPTQKTRMFPFPLPLEKPECPLFRSKNQNVPFSAPDNTQVTDAGLEQIAGLVELRHLGLNDTQITDDGMKHLKGLKGLDGLSVMGIKVTPAGCKELKEALPSLSNLWSDDE